MMEMESVHRVTIRVSLWEWRDQKHIWRQKLLYDAHKISNIDLDKYIGSMCETYYYKNNFILPMHSKKLLDKKCKKSVTVSSFFGSTTEHLFHMSIHLFILFYFILFIAETKWATLIWLAWPYYTSVTRTFNCSSTSSSVKQLVVFPNTNKTKFFRR